MRLNDDTKSCVPVQVAGYKLAHNNVRRDINLFRCGYCKNAETMQNMLIQPFVYAKPGESGVECGYISGDLQ